MDNKQYTWRWANSERFSSSLDSINECLEEARAENDENYKRVYIGIVTEVDIRVDADDVIENIQNRVYSEHGEVAEEYLDDVTKEQLNELDEALNKVFNEWKDKYKFEPNFFTVEEIKEYDLVTGEFLAYVE